MKVIHYLIKKEVILVILFLLLIPLAYSFKGSGGTYNVSVAQMAQIGAYNGSGGSYLLRITMGQVAVGNGTGGGYTVWLGYIHLLNTAPVIDAVAIHANTTSSYYMSHGYTNHTLICEVNVTDYDGSGTELEINVTWFRNSTAWGTDNETFTHNLSGTTSYRLNTTTVGSVESSDTKHDDTWICSVKVTDGIDKSSWTNSSGFYIYNAPPDLDSSQPTTITWNEDTNGTIDLTDYFSDIDGDDLDYDIAWTSSQYGGGYFTINNITITINNNTGIVTLDTNINVTGIMNIIFNATDHRTNDWGVTNTSTMTLNVTQVNDPPWATDVYIYPYSAEYRDTLSCEYTYHDLENNAEDTAGAAYKWFIKDEGVGSFSQVSGETSKTLAPANFDLNDVLICSVKVMDDQGGVAKTYVNSTERTIVTVAEERVETNIVIGIG